MLLENYRCCNQGLLQNALTAAGWAELPTLLKTGHYSESS